MPHKESLYPRDWLAVGQKDSERAKILFSNGDLEGAGFHLQQAVEKSIKGYLLFKGWKLKRIHDLEALLNTAIIYNAAFERFRELCIKTTNFYIEERYPVSVHSKLDKKELKDLIDQAGQILEEIHRVIYSAK